MFGAIRIARGLQRPRPGRFLGETEGGAADQRRRQRRLVLGAQEVEVAAALVGGGGIGGYRLVGPPGRLDERFALHHLRNDHEAAHDELVRVRPGAGPRRARGGREARVFGGRCRM
ncbi:hypothetical protein AB0478_45855 [Streptomyces sp. NPDC051917]|uniref:hypothetical protein n=1 Tax=Streptomyces sp. NPDC051917 TaxID=3154754 RepID=UPI0034521CB2